MKDGTLHRIKNTPKYNKIFIHEIYKSVKTVIKVLTPTATNMLHALHHLSLLRNILISLCITMNDSLHSSYSLYALVCVLLN